LAKRFSLVLAILVFSLADLVWRGRHAVTVVAQNLPNPRNSTGLRIVDLVHPMPAFARIYDLTVEPAEKGLSVPAAGQHLELQLSSNGKTRLLIVRSGHPRASRRSALWDLVRGRARLQAVADRGWVDLGPLPAGAFPFQVQVVGVLPAPYGFAELNRPVHPSFARITARLPSAPDAGIVTMAPRYRIVRPSPLAPGETVARFFFFISASRVLLLASLVALVLLVFGWQSLRSGRGTRAVCCLIPAVTLLHAVCLPPLQGADETSHIGTVEKIVFGEVPPRLETYPRSISLLAEALDQDRVQFYPDEPLPPGNSADRPRLKTFLGLSLTKEAAQDGPPPPAAGIQAIDTRSPLFFRPFRLPAPLLRKLSVLDRVSSYRLLATASGLLLFCCGAWLLYRARLSEQVTLLYGLVFLVPYMVATTASCSNYASAIGLGSMLAAAALSAVLAPSLRWKAIAAALLVLGSWIGIPIWPDFVFVALASTLVVFAWAIEQAVEALNSGARRVLRWVAGATLVILFLAGGVRLSHLKVGNIGTRLPLEMPRWGSHEMTLMILMATAPILLAIGAALAVSRLGRHDLPRVERDLRRVSIGLAVVLAVGFLLTSYTAVPYERTRLDFGGLVRAHNLSFWSNNFSWDQERLFWKFYWGAFGWHDGFYPDWLYALARWLCVGLFVALPFLCARFVADRPRLSGLLLLTSGIALSFCVVTEILRYLEPSNPWGRYILPYLPLAALPVLVSAEAPGRERPLRLAVAAGASLQVWTALVVLGSRYVFGS
jgi:hypothetical protein